MTTLSRIRGPVRRGLDLAGSLALLVVLVVVSALGMAGLPALGSVLNPGDGVWRLSADAGGANPEDITLPDLTKPVTISFEDNGLAHVDARTDLDLFRSIGYLHARFRLFQMDLTRRQANGELAEVIGPDALESDRFERDLGLRRAAERDWNAMPGDDPARAVLTAYSSGINTAIRQLGDDDRLPTQFTMLDYAPREWTPVDTLAVQRLVGQKISYDSQGVLMSYAEQALGNKVFKAWFPDVPANVQHPYDKGPFTKKPLEALPVTADPGPVDQSKGGSDTVGAPAAPAPADSSAVALSAGLKPLEERLDRLPEGAVNAMGHSNSWVVAGSRTESGKPILSADPHLPHSLPSIWYQVEGTSPGYHFSGATTPGIPVPLLGKTDKFSWGLTASQRPTTLYYVEKTDRARPDQFYWRGAWRDVAVIDEPIKVRGADTENHQVRLTAHGPILQVEGRTMSVWWAGVLPSDNLDSILGMLRSTTVDQFHESLRGWATPALNFSYANAEGDIAMFNVGVAPQVASHLPTLPLPGDGTADVVGTIAYDELPASVNPPEGYIESSNQREVPGDYPYQYSTSYNFVVHGWKDAEVVARLTAGDKISLADSARLQTDWHDNNARQLIPAMLKALEGDKLSPTERRVADLMSTWDFNATPDAVQPAFFDSFKNRLSWATFAPWWTHYHVKQNPGEYLLPRNPDAGAWANETLRATVLDWVLNDPDNPFFSTPDGTKRDATDVLQEAFHQTVKQTVGKYGEDFAGWRYDSYQSVLFPSLMGLSSLDRGPYPWGGNPRTVNTSVGTRDDEKGNPLSNLATAGPTWRMDVDWGTGEQGTVFPAGQSENPMSPWYDNGIPLWMKGRLWPMREGEEIETVHTVRWKVTP
ncbi:penicillin acylase family protein [Actinophytocola sp.]|uniref:penicillin acylase family protein n=1 Tax=Actinophytocola sp. TaxID=1872138 RepID=UPI002ED83647